MKYLFSLIALTLLMSCDENKMESSIHRVSLIHKMDTVKVTIEANDTMQYNIDEIVVLENQLIQLTLKHTGKMPLSQMVHNWVLLKAGVDVYDFGMKAMKASETNYIPEADKEKVIANTKTIGGGEQDVIEFEAPKAGTYVYCCTFPNHFVLMQGKLIVMEK